MEPTLPEAPRTRVIATHQPVRLGNGDVLLRCHVHAGAIEVLIPEALWQGKCVALPPPVIVEGITSGPAFDTAVAGAIAMGGFGRGGKTGGYLRDYCARHGVNSDAFRSAYHAAYVREHRTARRSRARAEARK